MLHDIFSKSNSSKTNNSRNFFTKGGRASSESSQSGAQDSRSVRRKNSEGIWENSNKKISSKFPPIQIDYREKNSLVPTKLLKLNHKIEFKELKVADYIINNTAIERKTIQDFTQSMINNRLKKQLQEIKQYPNHLLIVEGEFNFEPSGRVGNAEQLGGRQREIHPNALKGFILSITLNHKIPIIFTKNEEETADYISLLAKRKSSPSSINPTKSNLSQNKQLEYILQSFPKIGPTKSKQLLTKFRTLKNIFNEKEENLKPILNKNSFKFISLLNSKYNLKQ